jgi:hypothetical protein
MAAKTSEYHPPLGRDRILAMVRAGEPLRWMPRSVSGRLRSGKPDVRDLWLGRLMVSEYGDDQGAITLMAERRELVPGPERHGILHLVPPCPRCGRAMEKAVVWTAPAGETVRWDCPQCQSDS